MEGRDWRGRVGMDGENNERVLWIIGCSKIGGWGGGGGMWCVGCE